MIIPTITELNLVTVLHRGVPNKECVAIKVTQTVDVADIGLFVGMRTPEGGVIPYRDHFLWLGNAVLEAGDWMFVYTGGGKPSSTKSNDDLNNLYSVYWGRPKTVFADARVVPVLFRLNAMTVEPVRLDAPQAAGAALE
jgi:hypothetical protein